MSQSGYSTPTSGFSRLPPIVTNDLDREFLRMLNEYIELELGRVDADDDEQRYIIYKTAFNQIIDHVTAYQPILMTIKKEYEDTIEAIKKAQREATFLHGKLKAMASEPSTIRNYRKRGDELEERLNIVKKDNKQLQNQLTALKLQRTEREKQEKEIAEPPKRELKKDHRLIPGLTLEECTNKVLLQDKLAEIDRQLKDLTISFKTRYVPKTKQMDLKEGLDKKVAFRDMLLRQGHFYKAKRQRLKVALEAAKAYNREKPPHQTVGDTVMMALQYAAMQARKQRESETTTETQGQSEGGVTREGSGVVDGAQTASTFEDDDPNKEKEAEMMLEYIEKFNELFEDGKYEEAAIHAANSPKGILRTSATLAKFRDVNMRINGRTPLLMFCDALMSSAGTENARPDNQLSFECVECALYENRLDLLSHWISQNRKESGDRMYSLFTQATRPTSVMKQIPAARQLLKAILTFTAEIGHIVAGHCKCSIPCRCTAQAMAQNVFTKLRLYKDAVVCLLKQGRIRAGLQLAQTKAPFSREEYIQVLRSCPSIQLMHALVEGRSPTDRCLPIGRVIMTLVQEGKFEMALPFMQEQQNMPSLDEPKTSAFYAAVLDDSDTSLEDWNELVLLLQDHDYQETAINILSAITVLDAMKNALRTSQELVRQSMEERADA